MKAIDENEGSSMMQCRSCGTQLTTNMEYCPVCGTVALSSVSDAKLLSSNLPTTPSTQSPLMQALPPTDAHSFPYEVSSPYVYDPSSPYHIPPPPPLAHRYFSLRLVVLTIVLVVLLSSIVSGGIVYYLTNFSSHQKQVQVTPPVSISSSTPTIAPIPFTYTSEAASATNTLIGGAGIYACSACSTGRKVGFVGNSGAIQFNGINVQRTNTYTLTIYYCSAELRYALMSIDGASGTQLSFSSTGSYDTPGPLTVSIKLYAGSNTIKFYNPSGWAPDFDRIVITSPNQ